MYPRLVIDTKKITHNVKTIVEKCKACGLSAMGVTKVFCADANILQCYIDGGVDYLADSRIDNLKALTDFDLPKVLLRLPSLSQVDKVVAYADISLNSEIATVKALDFAAQVANKVHQVILMIDLGDLREGVWPSDFNEIVEEILKLKHIKLVGIGVNLTCYGGVIPQNSNLRQLVDLARGFKRDYQLDLEIISGGNSSSLYLLDKGEIPTGVNNLRIGEALVLGRETAYGEPVVDTYQNAFRLEAEIIEKKVKPSLPIGEIGRDAFGNKPVFEDKGERVRAILAVGRQDVKIENLLPVDKKINIIGASSDHLIVDLTEVNKEYDVGDIITFDLEYGALLSLSTSAYVKRLYK